MVKKLFALIFLMLFLVGTASALDFGFDNFKVFKENSNYGTIEIWDKGQINPDKKLVEYTLEENTNQCLIDCYAEGTATLYTRGKLFSKMRFSKEIRSSNLFIEKTEEYNETIKEYEKVCDGELNITGGLECDTIQTGTSEITKYRTYWEEYDFKKLDEGEYRWRIEGKKKKRERVDWVTTSFGRDLDEWAWWNSDWGLKKEITVEGGKSTLNNFSVFFQVTSGNNSANYSDLRFLDSTESTELVCDKEYHNSSNAYIWCKVPTLNTGANTFYMYYNNSAAPKSWDNASTWNWGSGANYNLIYHLTANGAVAGSDSAGNTDITTALGTPTIVQGMFGNASNFTGQSLQANDAKFTDVWTVAYLIKPSKLTSTEIVGGYRPGGSGFDVGDWEIGRGNSAKQKLTLETGVAWTHFEAIGPTGDIAINQWDVFVFTQNGTSVQAFRNGVNTNSTTWANGISGFVAIGNNTDGGIGTSALNGFDGIIDEMWFMNNTVWNNDTAERYYNQTDSSLVVFGTETVDIKSPNVALHIPLNITISNLSDVDFNCSATDEDGFIQNISLYLNETFVYNVTNGVTNSSELNVTFTLADGNYNWTCNAYDDIGGLGSNTTRFFNVSTIPGIDFLNPTPINDTNQSTNSFVVNVSLTETYFLNLTFLLHNSTGEYDKTTYTTGTRFINWSSLPDGDYTYNATAGTTTNRVNTTGTREIKIDTTAPTIIDALNITDLTFDLTTINSTWQYNVTDPNIQSCFYNTSDAETLVTITCNSTSKTNWTTSGTKMIYYYANDKVGNENYKNNSLFVRLYNYTQSTNKTSLSEGQDAFFNLTVDATAIPSTSATLWYNGTGYAATTTEGGTNQYNFSRTITVPQNIGNSTGRNATWYWEYKMNGLLAANTSFQNQTVYGLDMDNCTANTVVIVNMSLMDEEKNTNMSTEFNTTIEVDISLTAGSVIETFSITFTNETGASICIPDTSLNDLSTEYLMDLIVRYDADTYVEEYYYIDSEPISNTTVPEFIYLRDLLAVDSQSFVVSFSGDDGLLVDNAIIYLLRKYVGDGVFREVEASKTDNDGETILHLVEEDVIYKFNVTKNGVVLWTSEDYRVYCAAAPCELELSSDGTVTFFPDDWDKVPEGTYSVSSDQLTRKITLAFNLNESAEMNLTVYEYSNNATIMSIPIESKTLTASSGSIEITVPLSYGNKTFYSVVSKDNQFVASQWSALQESARNYFGDWILILVGLMVLCLGLIAVSTGVGMIVFAIFGLIISVVLQLLDMSYTVLMFIIVAGVLLIWKVIQRRGD